MRPLALILAVALLTSAPAFAESTNKVVTDPFAPSASSSEEDDTSSVTDDSSMMDASSSEEPAPADDAGLVTAEDPQTVVDALEALGYPAELGALDDGSPTISLRIAELNTYIDFYDCDDDMADCYTLLFGVDLDLKDGTTPGRVNEWNRKHVIGRVWTDDNADPTLDQALSTYDGISTDVFASNVKTWAEVVEQFKTFFDFK